MKKLFAEFRTFITKGNVVGLAVGVMIGAAFNAIVNSLVGDIISPVIGLATDMHLSDLGWQIGSVKIGYGAFLTAIINFLLTAVVLFFIVKLFDMMQNAGKKIKKRRAGDPEPEPAPPTTKICPFCKTEIAVDATRCPNCTSVLDAE